MQFMVTIKNSQEIHHFKNSQILAVMHILLLEFLGQGPNCLAAEMMTKLINW